jgi:hypothetical protein
VYSGPSGTAGVGICTAPTEECNAGVVVCVGEVTPTTEVCDNLDNDCDSETDEDADVAVPCIFGTCDAIQAMLPPGMIARVFQDTASEKGARRCALRSVCTGTAV